MEGNDQRSPDDKYIRPVEPHKCNYCRFRGIYDLGVANFQTGNNNEAIPLLEAASERQLSQNMECCGFESSVAYILGIRGRLRFLYTEELVVNLATSGESQKVQLAKALRDTLSGSGCNDVKESLQSLKRLDDLVLENGKLPEVGAYNKKNFCLSTKYTKLKLYMLGNVFPEAGIKIDWTQKEHDK
jgi:hypothetical protein